MGAAPSIRADAAGSNGQRGSSEQGCLQVKRPASAGNDERMGPSLSWANKHFRAEKLMFKSLIRHFVLCVQGVISSVLLPAHSLNCG
jgi:hypothetical protein